MEEKKYLKWWQKVAYGSGDLGTNFAYTFISIFVLIYLTDAVGLNAGIIGTLIMIAKLLDGVTDVIFGTIMDKTHTKMGKARPWMFWTIFPMAVCEILLFTIPDISSVLQYAYFFVIYTLLNAFFFTASNISYTSLTALITKNPNERVQIGSIRFIFALVGALTISVATVGLVGAFGGGAYGWRMVAIIYTFIMVVVMMLSVLLVKELPEEEQEAKKNVKKEITLANNARLLIRNKYYLLILGYYILTNLMVAITGGVGIYYCTHVLKNANIFGIFSMVGMLPMIIGLIATPMLVSKFGIYKVNKYGMILSVIFSIPFVIAGLMQNVPLMLFFMALKTLGTSPMLGTLNAVIADASTYTYRKDGIHLDGTMYSCSSMGIKVGSGLGSAVCGWLLALAGYDGLAETQTAGALHMISFMYLFIPLIISVLSVFIVSAMNVEKANKDLDAKNAA